MDETYQLSLTKHCISKTVSFGTREVILISTENIVSQTHKIGLEKAACNCREKSMGREACFPTKGINIPSQNNYCIKLTTDL